MWYSGELYGYAWEAKVYDYGSKYGINGGRISKLIIKDYYGNNLVIYEREWCKKPKGDVVDVYNILIDELENIPA